MIDFCALLTFQIRPNLYALLPLYKEEMIFKQKEGGEALLQKMAGINGFGMILFPDRPNVCLPEQEKEV